MRIGDGFAEHLESATDARDKTALFVQLQQFCLHAILPHPAEICHGAFCAGKNHPIRRAKLFRMCDIAERNGFHGIEYIEVREVRDVRQTNDGDVQSSTLLFSVLCQTLCQAVLLVQIDGRIRQNTEDRDSGQVLQHAQTALQNGHISTEFVDDNALDSPALLRFQQGNCAIQRGKYAATVDIAHQNYRRVGEVCHAHVDNIHGFRLISAGLPAPSSTMMSFSAARES